MTSSRPGSTRAGSATTASHRSSRSSCSTALYERRPTPRTTCSPPRCTFAGSEGIIPAPESAHAIHGAVLNAMAADDEGVERTILFNLSGHGHFDMAAYDDYLAGRLEDFALPEDEIQRALAAIEPLPKPA